MLATQRGEGLGCNALWVNVAMGVANCESSYGLMYPKDPLGRKQKTRPDISHVANWVSNTFPSFTRFEGVCLIAAFFGLSACR